MNPTPQIKVLSSHFVATGMVAWIAITMSATAAWVIAATADNDLVTVLKSSGVTAERFDSPEVAVAKAATGDGALVLADAYPEKATPLAPALFKKARAKKLRLYVEYPSYLPNQRIAKPQTLKTGQWGNILERTVVASDAFGDGLEKSRILMIHGRHYLPVEARHRRSHREVPDSLEELPEREGSHLPVDRESGEPFCDEEVGADKAKLWSGKRPGETMNLR